MTDDKLLGSKRKNDGRCNPEFQALKLYLGIPVGLKGGPLFEGFPIVRHGNTLECNTFFFWFMFFWRFDDSSIVSFTCSWKHFCWNSSAEGWNETSRCCTWRDELNVANGSLSPFMKLRPSRADSAKSDPLKILVEFQIGLYSKRYDSSEKPLGLKSNSLNIISLLFLGTH